MVWSGTAIGKHAEARSVKKGRSAIKLRAILLLQ